MDKDILWFNNFLKTKSYQLLQKRPIAYFCAEFAFDDNFPIFAGGLGVLAADFVKEADSLHIPLVAIGIYYNQGYIRKTVDENGQIIEVEKPINIDSIDLIPVKSECGDRIFITVPIENRSVHIQAWKIEIGSVNIYLLDTNMENNSQEDRAITKNLYPADKKNRFQQSMILGIGGQKLLSKLGINPLIYHMNEGHSALLSLELIKSEMKLKQVGFLEAKDTIKKGIVFTNHTLVIAGNDLFDKNLVAPILGKYADEELQTPLSDILALGKDKNTNMFSMTTFSFSVSVKVNAVSKLHAVNANKIWSHHSLISVTNGINIDRWDELHSSNQLWQAHQTNKRKLLSLIKEKTGQIWGENELLLGWARRMVEYKRPLALLENLNRFLTLAKKDHRTIRIVYSGEAHPSDIAGLELIRILRKKIQNELQGVAVYLSNFNLFLASTMVAGCDIWLNTPVVGSEACGTSTMKAALNGALLVSTRDGWIDETDLCGIGWILDNDNLNNSLLDCLERQIVPLYYQKDEDSISKNWLINMKKSRKLILENYSGTRMLREYIEKLYLPIIKTSLHNSYE